MLSDHVRDLVALASFIVSVLSLAFTVVQITKTKKAADAARDAAIATLTQNSQQYQRYVVTNWIRFFNELKLHIESRDWALASLRVSDLADHFVQLSTAKTDFGKQIQSLRKWETTFKLLKVDGSKKFEETKWNSFSNGLQKLIDPLHRPFVETHREVTDGSNS